MIWIHNLVWTCYILLFIFQNVRLTLKIDCPVSNLPNEDYRKELILNATKQAKDLYADGVNIDIEQAIEKGSKEEVALTLFAKELTEAVHSEIPGSQVSSTMYKCINRHIQALS